NFKDTMPLMWLENLPNFNGNVQSLENALATNSFLPFPPAIDGMWAFPIPSNRRTPENMGLLHAQKERFEKDWAIVSASLPEASVDSYIYYWLIVNTRSCYFEIPKKNAQLNRKDRMMLCPYIDIFNHADQGVAMRTITLSDDDWHKFLNGIEPDDLQDEVKADAFIERHVIEPFLAEVKIAISILDRRDEQCSTAPRKILLSRWRQIMAMLQSVAGKVQKE
ncbi:MAG: hypothetical protein Q9214_002771, partial [Letrouitia sp. 1 TL-2023]